MKTNRNPRDLRTDGRVPILRLEGDRTIYQLYSDGSATFRRGDQELVFGAVGLQEEGEVENGLCWHRTDRMIGEQYACRFRVEALGEGRARFVVIGEEGEERGAFVCGFRLDGDSLEVTIAEVDGSLPSLCFPTPIRSSSLVLPRGSGEWVRRPLPKFARKVYRFAGHGLRMRWVGGMTDENRGPGWVAIFGVGHADAAVMHAGMNLAPLWLRSLGKWNGIRTVRYSFTQDGYVGMAKTFRRWAQENGLFVSLAEKRETRPHLGHLIGGRKLSILFAIPFRHSTFENQWLEVPSRGVVAASHGARDSSVGEAGLPADGRVVVNSTYRQAIEIIEDARTLGWGGGLVQMPGWSHGGWDDQFPDTWPHEPACGTLADLEALWCLPGPQVVGILDNYADVYPQSPSFPDGILRRRDGSRLRGGIWMGGQCYLLDYGRALEKAKANGARYAAHGCRGVYCDTTTAVQFYENWDPAHLMTRAQDEERRVALLQHFRDLGMVIGSEVGCDFGVPVVDWSPAPKRGPVGESIPLWALVFHDAHIQFSPAMAVDPADERPCGDQDLVQFRRGMLDLLAAGCHLGHVRVTAPNWHRHRPMVAACAEFDAWNRRIGDREMIGHEFVDSDRRLERVTYAPGDALLINSSDQPFATDGGRVVPPWGFLEA